MRSDAGMVRERRGLGMILEHELERLCSSGAAELPGGVAAPGALARAPLGLEQAEGCAAARHVC